MKIALAALLALAVLAPACKKPEAQAPAAAPAAGGIHTTTGVIKEIKQDGKVLVIAHDEFPGFMEAMTMGFEMKDPAKSKEFKVGDKIKFSIQEAKDAWPIVDIVKAGR